MLIALANQVRSPGYRVRDSTHVVQDADHWQDALAQDKSFTLTLFAHDSTFTSLDAELASLAPGEPNPIVELFRREFPDALERMGEEALLKSWRENPKDGLITVEVRRPFRSGISGASIVPLVADERNGP
jgi:hypothetical protein